jgi:hypothetical protein
MSPKIIKFLILFITIIVMAAALKDKVSPHANSYLVKVVFD